MVGANSSTDADRNATGLPYGAMVSRSGSSRLTSSATNRCPAAERAVVIVVLPECDAPGSTIAPTCSGGGAGVQRHGRVVAAGGCRPSVDVHQEVRHE